MLKWYSRTHLQRLLLSDSYWEKPGLSCCLCVPLQPYIVEICDSLRGKIFQKFIERWDRGGGGGGDCMEEFTIYTKFTFYPFFFFFTPLVTNLLDFANGRTWSSTSTWVQAFWNYFLNLSLMHYSPTAAAKILLSTGVQHRANICIYRTVSLF